MICPRAHHPCVATMLVFRCRLSWSLIASLRTENPDVVLCAYHPDVVPPFCKQAFFCDAALCYSSGCCQRRGGCSFLIAVYALMASRCRTRGHFSVAATCTRVVRSFEEHKRVGICLPLNVALVVFLSCSREPIVSPDRR